MYNKKLARPGTQSQRITSTRRKKRASQSKIYDVTYVTFNEKNEDTENIELTEQHSGGQNATITTIRKEAQGIITIDRDINETAADTLETKRESGSQTLPSTLRPASPPMNLPPATTRGVANDEESLRSPIVRTGARQLLALFAIWLFVVVYIILYDIYLCEALLSPNPRLSTFLLSAQNTNLLVSILSAIFGILITYLLTDILNRVRWSIASRPSGMRLPAFLAITSATEWLSALSLMIQEPTVLSVGLCLIRLGLPIVGLYFGAILKVNATFAFYFLKTGVPVEVYAGLAVFDRRILNIIRPSRIALYFLGFMMTFQDNTKFVWKGETIRTCIYNCTVLTFTGGQETARAFGQTTDKTLFEGDIFQGYPAIQIKDTPAFVVTFEWLSTEVDFDRNNDCRLYGQQKNDSIQICIKTVNSSVAVAWAACPTKHLDAETCVADTSWAHLQMRTAVLMTTYKQRFTTTYRRADGFIEDAYATSDLELQAVDPSDFIALWDRLFIPTSSSNSQDLSMINDITFSLGWLIRLYDDEYPDDVNTPRRYLENFLSIPLQFMVTALEFLNQTSSVGGLFPLSNDMKTTAAGGVIMDRFKGSLWVVLLFISTSAITVATVGLFLLWIFVQREPLSHLTGIQEIDFLARAVGVGGNHEEERPLLEMLQLNNLPDSSSRPKISRKTKGLTALLRPGNAFSSEGEVLLARAV